MFVPQSWLEEVLQRKNPDWSATTQEIDDGFVAVGFEIEDVPRPLPETTGPLVIGRVVEIEELTEFRKPIRFCHVDVGRENGELQEIICGAQNFKLNDLVVVALPGVVLPGNFEISERKTYGHMSRGMMCSVRELGIGEDHTGILVLRPGTAEPGDNAYDILQLDDTIFEVNITPDRGYGLSVRGLTRELASAFELDYEDLAQDQGLDAKGEAWPVSIDANTKARRFAARKVTGIDPAAKTPWWMERRLFLSGVRPISPAVDVTNYVMLELGQPMHAYDVEKLDGPIQVRFAHKDEKLVTIDHVERELSPEDVVIADNSGAIGIGGVMGGAATEVGDSTTDVLFEAANFEPHSVFRSGRFHKLSSESSRRFERQVDSALCDIAVDRAAKLLVEIAGGEISAGRTDVGAALEMEEILFPANEPDIVAGVDYPAGTTEKWLKEVGCTVKDAGDGMLKVVPPTWRPDLKQGSDLVEEVLRLEGLESIPVKLPQAPAGRGLTGAQRRRRVVNRALAYNGYVEVIPTPFMANNAFDAWGLDADDPRRNTTKVLNPLDSQAGTLATTLLPALFDVVHRNVARGQRDLSIYGMAQVCLPDDTTHPVGPVATDKRPSDAEVEELIEALPQQPLYVATVLTGLREPAGFWGAGRPADLWDAIESARIVGRAAGCEFRFEKTTYLPWHPGRCAAIYLDDKLVGHAGELHPAIIEKLGLPSRTCAMELNVSELPTEYPGQAPTVSSYPAVFQDIALVVDKDIPQQDIVDTLLAAGQPLLDDVQLFDIYESDKLGEGKRSLAFSLTFRSTERTLTEDEASEVRDKAVSAVSEKYGAVLRAI